MEMTPVISSNIQAVGYDQEKKQLHVQFNGGAVYIYAEVPKEVFDELMAAESKGKFINSQIKGKFAATKQEKPE